MADQEDHDILPNDTNVSFSSHSFGDDGRSSGSISISDDDDDDDANNKNNDMEENRNIDIHLERQQQQVNDNNEARQEEMSYAGSTISDLVENGRAEIKEMYSTENVELALHIIESNDVVDSVDDDDDNDDDDYDNDDVDDSNGNSNNVVVVFDSEDDNNDSGDDNDDDDLSFGTKPDEIDTSVELSPNKSKSDDSKEDLVAVAASTVSNNANNNNESEEKPLLSKPSLFEHNLEIINNNSNDSFMEIPNKSESNSKDDLVVAAASTISENDNNQNKSQQESLPPKLSSPLKNKSYLNNNSNNSSMALSPEKSPSHLRAKTVPVMKNSSLMSLFDMPSLNTSTNTKTNMNHNETIMHNNKNNKISRLPSKPMNGQGDSKKMLQRQVTERRKNFPQCNSRKDIKRDDDDVDVDDEKININGRQANNSNQYLNSSAFSSIAYNDKKGSEMEQLLKDKNTHTSYTQTSPGFNSIYKQSQTPSGGPDDNYNEKIGKSISSFKLPSSEYILNGIAGSLIFGLFHIVFCLAQASAITRPFTNRPVIGPMIRIGAMGSVITTPFFLVMMGNSFPDLYPSIDVFPAPFYAQQARIIDEMLFNDGLGDDDDLFLTTFSVLTGLGLFLTGVLLVIATKFKLANLGAFLPYPVMAGFFSTVGLLIWTLAFSIDTGKHIGEVFAADFGLDQFKSCMLHHVVSILVVLVMQKVGKVSNSLVPLITLITIPGAHLLLFLTGTNLDDARKLGWFWYNHDFKTTNTGFKNFAPPLPFGVIAGVLEGNVHWDAVWKALPVTIALSLIFFIRCSLHAPALRKTTDNIMKWREEQERKCSTQDDDDDNNDEENFALSERPTEKINPMSTGDVYSVYGMLLALVSFAGGAACLPSLGPSSTIIKLGATGSFPQYGSALVLLGFYLTDFSLLGYIPKVTFSSLLVLASFTMLQDWFLKSYSKIKEKGEWVVVPLITVLSFTVGSLPSVFIGIAISTFIFVGAFYRSGVVKYIANGLTVHSTTERNPSDTTWLDVHGDFIQLMVLQNYLFFGNANSCHNYVQTMFKDPLPDVAEKLELPLPPLPPVPKYLIIDFTMVTGIDASAVDIFADIISLCKAHQCKVFLSGLRKDLLSILKCGGVEPSRRNKKSTFSVLTLHSDMDAALRIAEDALLRKLCRNEEKEIHRRASSVVINSEDAFVHAFVHALEQIDSQHGMKIASKLKGLAPYTEVVDLSQGQSLDEQCSGLFFIEYGILKVERDAGMTTRKMRTKGGAGLLYATPRITSNNSSIGHLRVRTHTIGKESALLKQARMTGEHLHRVPIGRIGPGFVVGSLEVCVSSFNYDQGIHTAVTPCRLHLLSHESIQEIEVQNPQLALELYKMMSKISSKRQASTIDQLATLQSIMSSLAPTKPVDRLTMAAIQQAMKSM